VIRFELIQPEGTGVTDRHDSPASSHSQIEDEERFELSTISLTSHRSAIELFIHMVVPEGFEPSTLPILIGMHLTIELRNYFVMTKGLEPLTTIVSG
jgi:hypothetical protein